ncbi:DUF885 family protein [Modestobacter sp. I12A-02628]|uniref:DUF885 domain-containing protein n=1 Tax=Goekera deserti TaxID=2497753 RepID=A0A7K3WCY6_9ACTN|nr:DUF885 domain-containing protein [Goekera deserti]MPQ98234.1 DUF885 family protein [Goekera deserti]NDI48060.1 DUF885 family protein [Goekera deserti]NEL53809.1 DUF885 domain-containing protein [Goekera deserti]
MTEPTRPASPLDRLADAYVDEYAASQPVIATYIGVPGHDDRWPDLTTAGHEAHAGLLRRTIAAVQRTEPVDRRDEVARGAMLERLGAELARYDAGLAQSQLNSTQSPLQEFRVVFDLMPVDTEDDWAVVARRLTALPDALQGYLAGLTDAGRVPAARQLRLAAASARKWAGDPARPGFYAGLVAGAAVSGPLAADLARAAEGVGAAMHAFADAVERDLLPRAPEADGVGREVYAVESRWFTGADLDLDETYAWGWEELARVRAEKEAVAESIAPGQGIAGAMAALDADPARMVRGREALQEWLQRTADQAIAALDGTHFDLDPRVRRIEGLLTPTSGEGVYYSGPTEDFSRPGRMWWSLPDGVTDMTTWRETTTVFHEGAPGHHLQIGQQVANAALLNRWQRLLALCSAHAEGWALYAERLMGELGFLDDPGDRLGMLDAQELRAARVVLDIGVHLDLPIPPGAAEGPRWTYDVALAFLRHHVSMEDAMLVDELHRYLGWPGQAPVYKVGERVFLTCREQARLRAGDDFDLAAWHRAVLDLGSLGLAPLTAELARM